VVPRRVVSRFAVIVAIVIAVGCQQGFVGPRPVIPRPPTRDQASYQLGYQGR